MQPLPNKSVVTVLATMLCCVAGFAQSAPAVAAPAQDAARTPQLQVSPEAARRSFEAAADEEYTLGPDDQIAVDVPGRTELTKLYTIGPDGRISLPVAGVIQIGGMTRDQAGAAITQALAPYYAAVSATVTVEKYSSNRVVVLGNVEHPGVITFEGQPMLLEAISRAGLSQQQRDKPMGLPERIAIYRGNDQVLWVELRKMMDSGAAYPDLRLKKNDLIYVPSDAERTVSVMGEVMRPGSVHLLSNSTLSSVLAEAGGVNMDHAGSDAKIQIVDPSTGKTREVRYKEVLTASGASLEITLKPGDIIFVPSSKFYKTTYVFNQLSPIVSTATLASIYR